MKTSPVVDDDLLKTKLIEAYQADMSKSKIGRLRKQYQTINDLQSGGMSMEKILEVLNDSGLTLTMKTFNGYMHILRKENGDVNSHISKPIKSIEKAIATESISSPVKEKAKHISSSDQKKKLETIADEYCGNTSSYAKSFINKQE